MDKKVILSTVDHTLLKQTATWEDIKVICEDAMKYEVASVCIPPSFVKKAKDFVGDKMKVCTVIGFPNGYNTTAVKVFETVDAIKNGADEIDMVINLGMVKEKKFNEVTKEIKAIKEACKYKILKVIIETCLLTEEEKIQMCKCVTDAKADFIKTSTGFSTGGATLEDIILFRANIGSEVLIKAAGGIKDLDTAKVFIENGAKRLGTSSIIKIINNEEVIGY
ncbi:deoxyribose-phosphate aldolase [[Clostridium] sordellii]|uniref:Deoxyribose-phosphate aldolase n=1 Tax=Paraclostridium sordellii TaxID=1505 RepID=A0ABM9RPI2_PARSO|nr:deoxyribose-phosphate aldolase [Paeniclostridium sordellii]EPZ62307.1 deoxyribose-phosphate aldolase [[Clostridium] sordellii ATCC 9714] [Paeniclostridium sordellii ATCC 9714]CEJ73952.1 Deoxyribose-phosphate aldolase (Phosphodeoxyriboaldolase) (Deoxyriboaldolase) (DERA) [[Clostridium] sordellii] [Paeniclostridium sordellii]CEN69497.1 deoxyribose-phosphate aldolase [[Clostridium] sordellii] [Paeniclostridium sordellii]CEN72765.1 deoxyribose-phosphate aldolase [[Clostridium] sordellii] [Paenic